jgi:ABC-type transport system involved in cytochrome c biogenesis permease subunit
MDKQLYQNLDAFLYSLVAGSGLVVILTSGKTDKGAVTAFQVAYSILFCVVCYKTVLTGSKINLSQSDSMISKVMNFIIMFFPFLSILAVILWILILVSLYYDRITGGKVSDYYTSFMNIASVMLLIQIYMIFSEVGDKTPPLSLKTYSLLRLLAVLAGLSVITVSIVLRFYVTDC